MIVDLGCGLNKIPGAIGMDNVDLPGVDIVHDILNVPYPFDDRSVDVVYLNHVLEHFILADAQIILSEIHRILCPGGAAYIRVPHAFSVAAWADVTHKSSFVFISGNFFDKNSAKAYYKDLHAVWEIKQIRARVTWLNWKSYRLRQIDSVFSHWITKLLNWFLSRNDWPGGADLFIKLIPMFFVEIDWELRKPGK